MCVHVRVLVAMMRVRVCVRLCARVGDSVRMRACVVVMVMVCVYAHQHRTYTLGGGDTLVTTKKKEKEMHTPAAPVCTHLVVCAYVLDICGGGGVCFWLAFLFGVVGALGIVCVCECKWAFIYWVRESR